MTQVQKEYTKHLPKSSNSAKRKSRARSCAWKKQKPQEPVRVAGADGAPAHVTLRLAPRIQSSSDGKNTLSRERGKRHAYTAGRAPRASGTRLHPNHRSTAQRSPSGSTSAEASRARPSATRRSTRKPGDLRFEAPAPLFFAFLHVRATRVWRGSCAPRRRPQNSRSTWRARRRFKPGASGNSSGVVPSSCPTTRSPRPSERARAETRTLRAASPGTDRIYITGRA